MLGNGGLGYASQKYIFLKLYFKNTDLFKGVFYVTLMTFAIPFIKVPKYFLQNDVFYNVTFKSVLPQKHPQSSAKTVITI